MKSKISHVLVTLAVFAAHMIATLAASLAVLYVIATVGQKYELSTLLMLVHPHGLVIITIPLLFIFFFLVLSPINTRIRQRLTPEHGQRLSLLAAASFALSLGGIAIPIIGWIPGIIFGHFARRRCRNNPRISGETLALAGLFIGYGGLAYTVYQWLFILFL